MVTATPSVMQTQDAQKCMLPTPGFRSTRYITAAPHHSHSLRPPCVKCCAPLSWPSPGAGHGPGLLDQHAYHGLYDVKQVLFAMCERAAEVESQQM